MKALLLGLALLGIGLAHAQTQEEEAPPLNPFDFTANLQSNHLWRGLIITDKPMLAVNSTLAIDKQQKLKVGVWGGMAMANESDGTHYKEIDVYVQYQIGGLTVGLWDLYNTRNAKEVDVWDYDRKTSGHLLDLRTSYQFGEKFPLRVETNILLFGDNKVDSEIVMDGDDVVEHYTTYLELSYPAIANEKVTLKVIAAAAFALNGDRQFYGNGKEKFDMVNLGFNASKTLVISDQLSIPVWVATLWNPALNYARVQVAATLF